MTRARLGRDLRGRPLRALLLVSFLVASLLPAATGHGLRQADQLPAVLPDDYGTIDEVTLHYDEEIAEELAPFYRDLFHALGPDVHVRILFSGKGPMADFLMTWGDQITRPGRTLELINTGMELTIWARDRYIARESNDLTTVMPDFVPLTREQYEPAKLNELDAYLMLPTLHLAPEVSDTLLRLEGGNVVATRQHAFIGVNVIDDNPDVSYQDGSLLRLLDDITGRSVVPVRADDDDVPWCHVDMYLAPVDDRTLLLGDMNLGLSLLGYGPPGDCAADENEPLTIDASTWVPEQLDEIAARMSRLGFHVGRLPTLVDPEGSWMVTYTNVLMEQRDGHRRVLMPTYDFPALDDYAAKTYADLGFEVSRIDVSSLYENGGAIRCIVNVSKRRPPDMNRPVRTKPGRIEVHDVASALQAALDHASAEPDADDSVESMCPNMTP